MRPRFILLAVVMAGGPLGVPNTYAAVTAVSNPWASDGSGSEQNLYYWMTHNYGTEGTDWIRLDDDTDQVWFNPDGHATAKAIYAGNSQDLKYKGDVKGSIDIGANIGAEVKLPHTDGGEHFRWQDWSGGVLWSSDNADNTTDGGKDHMVSFQIGPAVDEKYVIAFEDLAGCDYDYNDLIVQVQFVSRSGSGSVPEPATLIIWSLLGAGSWLGMRVAQRGRRVGLQAWSPENREAIHEIVGRGMPR
jgi:hypothetical protein